MTDTHQDASPSGGLGAEFHPLDGDQLVDPYPFYARARAEEPVFFSPMLHAWVVTRFADVVSVLRDPETFSSRDTLDAPFDPPPEVLEVLMAGFRPVVHLVNSDPPAHTRLRALVGPGFAPPRVARLEPLVRRFAAELLDAVLPDGRCDLVRSFAYPLPMKVIMHMFGVPEDRMDQCKRWCDDAALFTFVLSSLPLERQVECAKSVVAFQDYVAELVAERAADPKDDLISDLLTAEDPEHGQLSPSEVEGLLPGFLLAGHESTANLIGNAVRLLLEDRTRWEGLVADPEQLDGVIDEALRLEPSFPGMVRTTTRPVALGGVELAEDARMLVLFASANHDDARYPEGDRFRVNRDAAPHLSFGRGIHYCIGASLARLEVRIALQELVGRVPSLRLTTDFTPTYAPMLMLRGLTHLDVEWD